MGRRQLNKSQALVRVLLGQDVAENFPEATVAHGIELFVIPSEICPISLMIPELFELFNWRQDRAFAVFLASYCELNSIDETGCFGNDIS